MCLDLILFSCYLQHPGFINNNQLLLPNDIAVLRVDRKINLTHPNIDKIEMMVDIHVAIQAVSAGSLDGDIQVSSCYNIIFILATQYVNM